MWMFICLVKMILANLDGCKVDQYSSCKKTNINCKIPILPIVEQIFEVQRRSISVEFEQTASIF
jgi:hypothetical protein